MSNTVVMDDELIKISKGSDGELGVTVEDDFVGGIMASTVAVSLMLRTLVNTGRINQLEADGLIRTFGDRVSRIAKQNGLLI